MERAKGDMAVLSLERKVMPDHARLLAHFKGICISHNDGESLRVLARGICDLISV